MRGALEFGVSHPNSPCMNQACEPVSDMRGSADYKRHLADELTRRTLRTAAERVPG